jgi:hypothetical protein
LPPCEFGWFQFQCLPHTTFWDTSCQWRMQGRWFSPRTPLSPDEWNWPPRYTSN